MSNVVPSELNNPEPGAILFVGRDPGRWETKVGRPFVGRAGNVFNECLDMAGLKRSDVNITNVVPTQPKANKFFLHSWEDIEQGQLRLRQLIAKLKPSAIVAMGNEACHSLISDWPDKGSIKTAYGIEDRRGFVWTYGSIPVMATIHPAYADRVWVPWAALLSHDMERAAELHRNGLTRPTREVRIVSSIRQGREAVAAIRAAGLIGCDIENYRDPIELACVGFAVSPELAYVFPATPEWLPIIQQLLEDPSLKFVFANGQYDRYFLRTKNAIEIASHEHDTQVGWHACYPELAGKSDWKSSRVTRKSLAFVASMCCWDEWWKDYDFQTEEERYILNGKDCCVTLDAMQRYLIPEIEKLGVESIYRHELGLIPLCLAGQERGIAIDNAERLDRIEKLSDYWTELQEQVQSAVMEEVEAEKDRIDCWHLFQDVWTCPCCRNGGSKRAHCTSCAGVIGTGANGAIKKGDLPGEGTKAERIEALPPCEVCDGEGQRTSLVFNLNSDDQVKALVYTVWRLPRKYNDKKLSVAEDKLKALQAYCSAKSRAVDSSIDWQLRAKVIRWIIEARRITTQRGIYRGLEPGPDGCIRTVMNPTGTETGRFSHGTSFLEPSRNLGNMPKKTAGLHPLFNVRAVMVPRDPSVCLMEADYSQAEARIAAWMAQDPLAIKQYEEGIDRYRFFASQFYDKPEEEITKPERHVGKTAVLALQYGVAWRTFMEHVNADEELTGASITAGEAKLAVQLYHELYPHYRTWHQRVWEEAARNGGYLRNVYGRRRDFFGRRSDDYEEEAVRREMVAFMPQSTSVDHLNARAAVVFQRLDPGRFLFLLQIHDAILGEVPVARYLQVGAAVKDILEEPLVIGGRELIVPAEVSVSRSSWAEMKELDL